MADNLNLEVIAEGVETEFQVRYFATVSRPILAQGWFFSRPISAAELRTLLAMQAKAALSAAGAA